MQSVRLTEIFFSLQGETRTVGIPTVFVRLTGCPLRCQYCDTAYAFHGGTKVSIEDILGRVKQYQTRYVTVTGGEPLAQKECIPLLQALCDADYQVSLETSGALSVQAVDARVNKVIDIKTPASGVVEKNNWENLLFLSRTDQVKFVICDRADYEWAKAILNKENLSERAEVLFSPSYEQLKAKDLADWILQDQLPVRLQIQLHKFLWGNEPGK